MRNLDSSWRSVTRRSRVGSPTRLRSNRKGTRVSGWLGDDDDIKAVLSGLAGRDALRGMLARLQPKEEVLLLGWGVPMPLPVKSRRYDDKFWKELLGGAMQPRTIREINEELGF